MTAGPEAAQIVVADDDLLFSSNLSASVGRLGYRPVVVRSEAALQAALREGPCAVIVNLAARGFDATEAIRRIKDNVGGGIYVSGSGTLVRALMADGLLDELHLFVYPITLGAGPRLFSEHASATWSLLRCDAYDNGVLYLVYRSRPAM